MYAPGDFVWFLVSWPNLVWTVIKVWQDVFKIVTVLFLPYKKSKQKYSVIFDPIPWNNIVRTVKTLKRFKRRRRVFCLSFKNKKRTSYNSSCS